MAVFPDDVAGTYASYAAVGLRVSLDASNCIVLRETRLHGPDIEITVTNVTELMLGLRAMQDYQRIRDEEAYRTPS